MPLVTGHDPRQTAYSHLVLVGDAAALPRNRIEIAK
jgi:hypothetical protein